MPFGFAFVLLTFLMQVMLFPVTAHAQTPASDDTCAAPGYRVDVRPDRNGSATLITIGVRVVDILAIDDVDQTISLDMAVRMTWQDPRLAPLAGCKLETQDVWFPRLFLKNSGRVFSRWPETVAVDEGGQVTYLQRKSGTFASYHNLHNFPFDQQSISLWVVPQEWSASKVQFRIDETFTGVSNLLNISDWEIKGLEARLIEEDLDAFDQPRAGFEITIPAQRYIGYYLWKILVPIALIVSMSWCVFWIDPKDFGTQLGLSATSVLTMIAFIFATTNMLPRLGYATILDDYIAAATLFVFLSLLQSLYTGYLTSIDRRARALRVDQISRFAFPVLFALVCGTFFMRLT